VSITEWDQDGAAGEIIQATLDVVSRDGATGMSACVCLGITSRGGSHWAYWEEGLELGLCRYTRLEGDGRHLQL
jgi:hypothetical protein